MLQAAIALLMIMGLIAGSALAAFWWAAKNRQFENVEEGSLTIFDADEPVGRSTDAFPGNRMTCTETFSRIPNDERN